jgi:hypothetical protein
MMLNIYETLKNLKKIKERSKDAKEIDDYVIKRVRNVCRELIHNNVKQTIDRIVRYGLQEAQRNLLSEKNIVVLSEYGVQSPTLKGHFQSCAPENLIVIPFIQNGKQTWAYGDTKDRRFLYLDEFEKRSRKLLDAILDGDLDDCLTEPSYELIHKIMGQKGELLQRLNIDPHIGESFKRISIILTGKKKIKTHTGEPMTHL